MALSAPLREKSSAIAQRWLADTLAAYPAESAAAFRREKDAFANPVGHALRQGTCAAVDAFVEGKEPEEICSHLDEIVKIRAVQELKPSQAISFVFLLKEALRAALKPKDAGVESLGELAELERRVDMVALSAFDIYTSYRGQVSELRINEIKRSVARLREAAQRSCPSRSWTDEGTQPGPSQGAEAQRGGGQ